MSRSYWVKINLDDLCAELDTLRPDQHAEWLAGFRAGSRGKIPDGWDGPRLMGAEFGLACHGEAEAFRATKAAGGKARQAQVKQAHAQHMLTSCSADAQHETQPTNNQQPTTTNQNPETKKERQVAVAPRFTAPSVNEVRDYCDEHGHAIDPDAFVDFYESKGWKVGNSPMKSWQAAVRTWVKRSYTQSQARPTKPVGTAEPAWDDGGPSPEQAYDIWKEAMAEREERLKVSP